jgi:hypothetical protein
MLLVLVGVVIHRGVDARIRIAGVAHQAARAASLERTPDAASIAADATATRALSSAGVACRSHEVTTSTDGLRPGDTIHVTVSCDVDLADALIPAAATRRISATASEPVDLWRSVSFGPTGNQP